LLKKLQGLGTALSGLDLEVILEQGLEYCEDLELVIDQEHASALGAGQPEALEQVFYGSGVHAVLLRSVVSRIAHPPRLLYCLISTASEMRVAG
jgi:hypothetical protein